MLPILLLPYRYLSQVILQRFTVRIHSGLIEKGRPWLKLWYLLRGLDFQGSGFAKISLNQVCQLLRCSSATVRQWLREGKAAGAFRFWRCTQQQGLRVALGGLHQLCKKLGLMNIEKPSREQQMWVSGLRRALTAWGAVAEIPLFQIHQLRPLATAAAAQKLQQRSRHAAWQSLPEEVRENWNLPEPEEFFRPGATPHSKGLKLKASQSASPVEEEQRPSDDTACGGIRCLIHIGTKRIFVSKGFVPFGTSQKSIAWERNYCDRTIQRHLAQINLPHKQLVQSKEAYKHLRRALQWDSPGIAPEPGISLSRLLDGRNVLSEISGTVGDKPYTQEIKAERFFRYGDRDWIYRTNLYKPELQLRTTRASIRNYRRLLKKSKKISRLQGGDGL